jgi:hypothetical protein
VVWIAVATVGVSCASLATGSSADPWLEGVEDACAIYFEQPGGRWAECKAHASYEIDLERPPQMPRGEWMARLRCEAGVRVIGEMERGRVVTEYDIDVDDAAAIEGLADELAPSVQLMAVEAGLCLEEEFGRR